MEQQQLLLLVTSSDGACSSLLEWMLQDDAAALQRQQQTGGTTAPGTAQNHLPPPLAPLRPSQARNRVLQFVGERTEHLRQEAPASWPGSRTHLSSQHTQRKDEATSLPPQQQQQEQQQQQQQGGPTAPQPVVNAQPKLHGAWAKGGQAAWAASDGNATKQESLLAKRMRGPPQQQPKQQPQQKGLQGSSHELPVKRISPSPAPWSAPAAQQPSALSQAQAAWPSLRASSSSANLSQGSAPSSAQAEHGQAPSRQAQAWPSRGASQASALQSSADKPTKIAPGVLKPCGRGSPTPIHAGPSQAKSPSDCDQTSKAHHAPQSRLDPRAQQPRQLAAQPAEGPPEVSPPHDARPGVPPVMPPSCHRAQAPSPSHITAGAPTAQDMPASGSTPTAPPPHLAPHLANSNGTTHSHMPALPAAAAAATAAAGGRPVEVLSASSTPPANTYTDSHARLARTHGTLLLHGKVHDSLQQHVLGLLSLLACALSTLSKAGAPSNSTSYSSPAKAEPTPPSPTSPPSSLLRGSPHPRGSTDKPSAASPGLPHMSTASDATCSSDARGSAFVDPWPAFVVVRYVAEALEHCAPLVCSLGRRLGSLLLEMQPFQAHCPRLMTRLKAMLAGHHAHAPYMDRSLDSVAGARPMTLVGMLHPQPGKLVAPGVPGAGVLTMASRGTQSADQQRRTANRERTRDAFFSWMKDASTLMRSLPPVAMEALSQELCARPSNVCGSSTPYAPQLEALLVLRSRASDLMASVHPANLPFLAELFTGCALQAATTGEAVMEEALANLAQRDPSRFQRLNRRMQAQDAPNHQPQKGGKLQPAPAPGPRQAGSVFGGLGGSNSSSATHSTSSAVGGRGGTGSSSGPGVRGGSVQMGSGSGSDSGGAIGGGAASSVASSMGKDGVLVLADRVAGCLQLLQEFPLVQQGYALFLEACNCYTFNHALARCMTVKLQDLLQTLPSGDPSPTTTPSHSSTTTRAGPASSDALPACNGHAQGTSSSSNPEDGEGTGDVHADGRAVPSETRHEEGALHKPGLKGIAPIHGLAPGAFGECVLAMYTLSSYLSFMLFATQQGAVQLESIREEAAVPPAWVSGSSRPGVHTTPNHRGLSPHHHNQHSSEDLLALRGTLLPAIRWPGLPVDLIQLLRTACDHAVLPAVLPAVAEMLAFVHWDPHAMRTAYFHDLLHLLCSLRAQPCLQPSHPGFGTAAICVRALLDDLLARLACALGVAPDELGGLILREGGGSAASSGADADARGRAPGSEHQHQHQQQPLHSNDKSCQPSEQGGKGEDPQLKGGAQPTARVEGDQGVHQSSAAPVPVASHVPLATLSDQAAAASGLQRWDLLINTRLLELCCPDLDACCRALQRAAVAHQGLLQAQREAAALAAASAAAANSHDTHAVPVEQRTPPQKCRRPQEGGGGAEVFGPATPPRPMAAVAPRKICLPAVHHRKQHGEGPNLPPKLAALVEGTQEGVQLQLQQALIAQYSTDEHPVKLREVVAFVASMLSANAFTAAVAAGMPATLAALSEQLTSLAAGIQHKLRPLTASRGAPTVIKSSSGQASVPALSFTPAELESVRGMLTSAVEPALGTAVQVQLAAAEEVCRNHISQAATAAMQGLLPPSMPPAARAAATHITSHTALVSCAQRLASQVPGFVRAQTMQQVDALARGLLKQDQQRASTDRQQNEQRLTQQQEHEAAGRGTSSAHAHAKTSASGTALPLPQLTNPKATAAQSEQGHTLPCGVTTHSPSQPGPPSQHPPAAKAEQGTPANPPAGLAHPSPPTAQEGTHTEGLHAVHAASPGSHQTLQAAAAQLAELVASASAACDPARTNSSCADATADAHASGQRGSLRPLALPHSSNPHPPAPSLFSHLVAWLCSIELSSFPAPPHQPDDAQPPNQATPSSHTQPPTAGADAHAAVGCAAAQLLHKRLLAGELHAGPLEQQLCSALQQANAAAAMQVLQPAGWQAQPPGKAAGAQRQQQQQQQHQAQHEHVCSTSPHQTSSPPVSAPAQAALEQDQTHVPTPHPPLPLPLYPTPADQPSVLQPPNPLIPCPSQAQPEEMSPGTPTPSSSQPAVRARGTALAQRILIWLCCTLFELHASHSMLCLVWEPGRAAMERDQPHLSATENHRQSHSSTTEHHSRSHSSTTQHHCQSHSSASGCAHGASQGAGSLTTTFMPMLTNLVQLLRTCSALGLLRHLRLTVQQATFSSIGLDFRVS